VAVEATDMVIAPQDGEEEEATVEVEALVGVEASEVEGLEAVGLVEIAWARLVLA